MPKTPPKEVEPPSDSCPTPILYLGWQDTVAEFEALAGQFRDREFVLRAEVERLRNDIHLLWKNPARMREADPLRRRCERALQEAGMCDASAHEAMRLADLAAKWPTLSGAALAGQKHYAVQRHADLKRAQARLLGE